MFILCIFILNLKFMKKLPSLNEIKTSLSTLWDFENKVLYDLCSANFYHNDNDKILAKVMLIGRAYSAAIERRKNKEESNDNFYILKVAPAFKNSIIDEYLNKLKSEDFLTLDNIPLVLEAHKYLTNLTYTLTELEKRSLSSKYLHFHLPKLFYIYDSRVVGSIRQFIDKVPESMERFVNSDKVDKEYAIFFCKCFSVMNSIKDTYKVDLTTRQFDNILINIANNKLDNKSSNKLES